MNAPKEITIKSDGNLLTLVEIKKNGDVVYKYSQSKTKKNQLLTLSENDLIKLIKINDNQI